MLARRLTMKTISKQKENVNFLQSDEYAHFISEGLQKKLLKTVSGIYVKHGETTKAVREIQYQLQRLITLHQGFQAIQKRSITLLQKTRKSKYHYIGRIIDNDDLKISLHCIPDRYEIPAHCHPGMVSVTYVFSGNLLISQSSLATGSKQAHKIVYKVKTRNTCAGLKNFRNIHKIQSLDTPSIYLSLRIKQKTIALKKKDNSYLEKLLLWLLSGALLWNPSFASDLQKDDCKIIKPVNILKNDHIKKMVHLSSTKELDDYEVAEFYLQAAKKGNAEAQYKLGIMYLEGVGITDDSDEAYRWITAAADQGYQPAEKLQNYLLTTIEILDC